MQANRISARAGKTPDVGELLLYGDVGPSEWGMIDDRAFADELKKLGEVRVLQLRINSAGGSAFTGVSIYNQLKRHAARVEVTVDGIAASIASVIAMAGETVRMGDGTQLMIHDASSLAWGNAAEMQRTGELLDSISHDLAEIYARRTGRSVHEMRDLMRAETWFGAEEAVEARLADEVIAGPRVEARLRPTEAARFKHPPKALLSTRQQHSVSRVADLAARARQYAKAGA